MSHSSIDRQTFLVPVNSDTIDALASGVAPAELAVAVEPDLNSLQLSAPPVWSTNTTDGRPLNHILYSDLDGIWTWWGVDEDDMAAMMAIYTAGLTPGMPTVDPAEVFPIERSEEEQALLSAIIAAPDEDVRRLEYAQWLSDRRDPRGEAIRLQIEMEHCDEQDEGNFPALWARFQALLAEHGREWFRPLAALHIWPTLGPEFCPEFFMSRGLLESVWIHRPDVLPAHAEELWSFAPTLNSLAFFETLDVPGLAALPQMQRVRELSILGNEPATAERDMAALAESPHFTNLRSLSLGYELSDEAGHKLLSAPWLRQLNELDLQRTQLPTSVVERLTASNEFDELSSLELAGPGVTPQAAENLSENPSFRSLSSLKLSEAPIAGASFRELMLAAWPKLESLDLSGCELRDDDVEFLANTPTLPKLESLNLQGAKIGTDGALALASSPYLQNLTSLDLDRNELSDEDVSELTLRFGEAVTIHE